MNPAAPEPVDVTTLARRLEALDTALSGEQRTWAQRGAGALAAKLGFAGSTVSALGIASTFGTASTGTAIGSLSGAAFESAALAWIGGSVALGTAATAGAGLGAAIGASLLTGRILRRRRAQRRRLPPEAQARLAEALAAIRALRAGLLASPGRHPLEGLAAAALQRKALAPLLVRLAHLQRGLRAHWTRADCRAVARATEGLCDVSEALDRRPTPHAPQCLGVSAAVLIKLLHGATEFSGEEHLVLQALRRSARELNEASEAQLATYVQALAPEQLAGVSNNIKGIYHELAFAARENADADAYTVELFPDTSHPGADILLRNELTGEVTQFQLKATDSLAYLGEHFERYPDIGVLATSGVAQASGRAGDTGFTNDELSGDVREALSELTDTAADALLNATFAATVVAAALISHECLRGRRIDETQTRRILQEAGVSASLAAGLTLILGS